VAPVGTEADSTGNPSAAPRAAADAFQNALAAAGDRPGHAAAPHGPTEAAADPASAAPPAEARFAARNHENIVTGLRGELLPGGGTMKIRLDPPQLGAMQVTVHMRDGVMAATFETSSGEATRLLSHSLGELKSALEAQGVSIDKIHVQQTPRDQQAPGERDDPNQRGRNAAHDEQAARQQEQQRREVLRRVWRKVSGEPDPLDLKA
jgi:flagellar hook-length control protein FliK